MINYLKNNAQFVLLSFTWLLAGIYGGPVIYALLPLTLLLLHNKQRHVELFFGFLFILILSDSRQDSLEFAKSLKNIYIILLAVFFFAKQKEFAPINRLYLQFISFFILSLFLVLNSPELSITFQKTISYILLFLLVPNYLSRLHQERGDEFLKELIYFGATILVTGLILTQVMKEVVFFEEKRYTGIFGNPNGLGIYCTLYFLLFSIITHFRKGLVSKNETVFIYACILVSVTMSGSRNTIIAILIYFFFVRFYKMSPILGFTLFLFFIVSYELINVNIETIVKSLGIEKYARSETLKDASGRLIAWKFAWEQVQKHFFFGQGFAFDEYIFKKFQTTLNQLGHQGGVHSTYLAFWLNTGLVGVLLFFRGFFLSFFLASKKTVLAFPVMFSVLFSITFEAWLMASLNPFTILFIIILTLLTSNELLEGKKEDIVPLH